VARRLAAVFAAGLGIALIAACGPASNGAQTQWQNGGTGGGSGGPTSGGPGSSTLTLSVKPNQTGVSPGDPITVALAPSGSIDSVSLMNASTGRVVSGTISADHLSWQSSEALGYDKSYNLVAEATGGDGGKLEQKASFHTVKPKNKTQPYVRANANMHLWDLPTYGVGQTIVVWFDEPIPDEATTEKYLHVTADPPVQGAWSWFSNREVHFRPETYWKSGTKVTVNVDTYGHDLGGGLYGDDAIQTSASFVVGPSHIAIADSVTHHMKVYIDGVEQKTIAGKSYPDGVPVSLGRTGTTTGSNGQVIDFRTHSGPHIVVDRQAVTKMSSASYGLADPTNPYYYAPVTVQWAVRISYGGEYVHSAPWSVNQQGHLNVSHGCINAAPAFAEWFYNTWQIGDIVDVRNTGKVLGDGTFDPDGPADWALSWATWLKNSKLGVIWAGDPSTLPATPSPSPSPSTSATG
jgi:lipoprotein-anchoring transpeptidase ErfK/SrfK